MDMYMLYCLLKSQIKSRGVIMGHEKCDVTVNTDHTARHSSYNVTIVLVQEISHHMVLAWCQINLLKSFNLPH